MAGIKDFVRSVWARPKRVPVIMQMESVECGAASLAMVMAYYKKWVPLEKVRLECGVSRDGCNVLNIVKCAQAYGFEVTAYRMDLEHVRTMNTPSIIHWDFNHFVVFNGFKGNKACLNDPAYGRTMVSMKTFNKSFTGVLVDLKPGPDFLPSGKPASVLRFVRQRLSGAKMALAYTLLSGLILSMLGIVTPLMSQIFMDDILPHEKPDWLVPFLSVFAFIVLAQCLVHLLNGFKWPVINAKLSTVSSANFMWHVLHLPLNFFQQRYVGDLLMRQASNQTIAANLTMEIAPTLTNLSLVALYLFVMFCYSTPLSLIAVLASTILLVTASRIAGKQMDMSRVLERDRGQLDSVSMNSIECMETIKAAGAELGFFQRWAGYFAVKANQEMKIVRVMSHLDLIPTLITHLADYTILVLGAYYILNGQLTIGMLLAFQGFITACDVPLGKLISTVKYLVEIRTQMERVEDVYRYKRDVPNPDFNEVVAGSGKLGGRVEVRHVSFGYSPLDSPVIKDLSFSVEPGKSVAFVGASGCGKSTIARLITGLYKPWSGEILLDGKPLDDIPRSVLLNSVAMVNQDIQLFSDTISNNVKIWDRSIEDFSMIMACNDAEIHKDIVCRPGGYQARLVDGGGNLSGGQRQRLEIASALMRDPTVLILDEVTSALDTKTEDRIMQNLRAMGISLIIIAHRQSTIRACDEIIVLDDGEVVERGTHDSLLALRGKYYELHKND